jgi:hypothetical protein
MQKVPIVIVEHPGIRQREIIGTTILSYPRALRENGTRRRRRDVCKA